MRMKGIFLALIILCSGFCRGQSSYTIPLEKLNTSLAVPAMVNRDGVVYVAYRSFNWLRQSDQLRMLAYDLHTRKLLRSGLISVPKVHGSRATNGLALSHDGTTLAYVEIHEPSLVLLISTKDLSEERRSTSVPFTEQDYVRSFAGFDGKDRLSFSSTNKEKPRFIRVSMEDFRTVSDTRATALDKDAFEYIAWDPVAGRFWLPYGSRVVQYNEQGIATGEELNTEIHQVQQGAIPLGHSDVIAFFAMVSRGAVASYTNHKTQSVELPCSPSPYGVSNDHAYAGAICVTQPDLLPEAGGMEILTSEFLLIRANGLRVDWRQSMFGLGAGDKAQFEWASPVIEHGEGHVWVVAPTQKAELAVYEVPIQK